MDDRRDMQNNRPQQNINLQPKDILEKDFKTKMRGYDPAEVDEFLDDVIKDYETFTNQIQQLSQENARMISRIDELSKQAGGQSMPANNVASGNSAGNYDLAKRVSNLERRVFGQSRGAEPAPQSGAGNPNQGVPANGQNNYANNPGALNNTITNRGANRYQQAGLANNTPAAPGMPQNNAYNNAAGNGQVVPNNAQCQTIRLMATSL